MISTDEMAGIQALEHKFPDKLLLPDHFAARDIEYIRNRTTSLISFFHITNGAMYPTYFKLAI